MNERGGGAWDVVARGGGDVVHERRASRSRRRWGVALIAWVALLLAAAAPSSAQVRPARAATIPSTSRDDAVKAVRAALREYLSALRAGAPFSTPLRARVLDVLESSWRAAPGDDFIAGQRVAFLVKDGKVEAAREAAAACSA